MRKLLSLLFVLVSFNCFAIDPELKENLKNIRTDNTRDFFSRFIVIIDKLEDPKDSLQKEILKVNLSIEAALIENGFKRDIEEHQQGIRSYENCIDNATTAAEIKNYLLAIKNRNQEIDQTHKYLQLIQQVTEELMQY